MVGAAVVVGAVVGAAVVGAAVVGAAAGAVVAGGAVVEEGSAARSPAVVVVGLGAGVGAAEVVVASPRVDVVVLPVASVAAGLALAERWSTWDREPYEGGGYAVSVHRPT